MRGFQKEGHTDRIDDLVRSLSLHEVLSLDREVAVIAGMIAGKLQRIGQSIGHADPLIAALAIHHELLLVTGNTAHFERIVSLGFPLRLDNWRA